MDRSSPYARHWQNTTNIKLKPIDKKNSMNSDSSTRSEISKPSEVLDKHLNKKQES